MKLKNLLIISLVVIALMLSACGSGSAGQGKAEASVDFPTKSVTLIVPSSGGGPTDITARILADAMNQDFPQSVVVENIPGAGGIVGTTACYTAEPDGYTIILETSPTMALNVFSDDKSYNYDEFEFLIATCYDPQVIVVSAESDIYTIADLIKYAETNRVIIADTGSTTVTHFAGVDLVDQLGIKDFAFVSFNGNSGQLPAVAAGDCTLGSCSTSGGMAMIAAGQLRPICILSGERVKDFPDVETADEAGYPNLHHYSIRGVVATPGTPKEVCDILIEAMYKAVERDDYKEAEQNAGLTRGIMTGEEFKTQMTNDLENYKRLVELEKSWSN